VERKVRAIEPAGRKPVNLFFGEGPMSRKKQGAGNRRRRWFRCVCRGFGVCLVGVLVVSWGCSEREDTHSEEKNKVVIVIRKPMPEPAPEKKAEVVPPTPEKEAAPAVVPENGTSPKEGSTAGQEPSAPETAAASKPAPAEVETEVKPLEKPGAAKAEKGLVQVRKGESLSAVAAREDVYGDALKWPRLYRLNPGSVVTIRTWEDIRKKPLPEGLSLRYVLLTREKGGEAPVEAGSWVITVLSRQSPEKLTGPAITLLENGYHVYIAKAVVKDKPWLRLRVGFYKNKADALQAKKKIQEILGSDDTWVSRAGEKELEEFRDH
jgi:hypothetical protein